MQHQETSCEAVLKSLLYSSNFDIKAIDYSNKHEHKVTQNLELALYVKIMKCGLFIDLKDVFLGVTFDSLIGTETVVEIKCPYSAENIYPILHRKITF